MTSRFVLNFSHCVKIWEKLACSTLSQTTVHVVVGIRLSRKTMVSALIGSQSCWEQRLEWLSNPILAWQSLPQLLQVYGVA